MTHSLKKASKGFKSDSRGAVSIPFALSIIPILATIGAAVDLGRAIVIGAEVQAGVDNALLTVVGASGDAAAKKANADAVLGAALEGRSTTTTFTVNADGTSTYTASTAMSTMFVPYIASSVTVTRKASAKATVAATAGTTTTTTTTTGAWTDDSCILTLGEDLDLDSDNIMTWNGSPSVQLTGCSLRSNRSMKCNGGSTGATASYAHGTVTGACPNPQSGVAEVPDTYAAYQTSVTPLCGTTKTGYTWANDGTLPAASAVVKYPATPNANYNEVHICGTLTLSGTRQILADVAGGTEPDKDTLIVVENGSISLGDNAAITAKRVTFILAGDNAGASDTDHAVVNWPTGNGKDADFIVTPGYHASNPFRGFALYQDPENDRDQTWKPGANARFDGTLYMPKAKLTLSGNMQYGSKSCLKIVVAQFTLNGNVSLQLTQNNASCSAISMRPYNYEGVTTVTTTTTAGTTAASSYLTK